MRAFHLLPLLLLVACDDPDSVAAEVDDCIPSGTEESIQAALTGPGSVAVLCPNARFDLSQSVRFTHDGQEIHTDGFPTGATRAMLRIVSPAVTTAVDMENRSDVRLSHVQVDGARPTLGPGGSGALIQAGGFVSGQVVQHVRALEPRGWTILHLFEGPVGNRCTDAQVLNNEFGPAGQPDGSWADGISLACTNSLVSGNTIVDATDGGIVVFGAPGSVIEGNTIRAQTRTLLGGINMVDYLPYAGDFTNTRVRNNVIDAAGARIQIGIGMGLRTWICFDPALEGYDDPTLRGAIVTGNQLRGTHMRYGFAVDGVEDWTVTGNTSTATHSGTPSRTCHGELAAEPAAFQRHGVHADGLFQPEFQEARVELALWAVDAPPP